MAHFLNNLVFLIWVYKSETRSNEWICQYFTRISKVCYIHWEYRRTF